MASLTPRRRCPSCGKKLSLKKDAIQCPFCGEFDLSVNSDDKTDGTVLLEDAIDMNLRRIKTGPWDACLGGGLVPGTVVLFGGNRGAGKSTIALQISDAIAETQKREMLYIAGEQSAPELKMYAHRMGILGRRRVRVFSALGGSTVADFDEALKTYKPCALVLDSLQGIMGSDDSPETAVELCKALKGYAVELDVPVIIISHMTKEGDFAGLEAIQHTVDALLTIFGEADEPREMRTPKSRIGPANVVLHLEMTERGLREYEIHDT
jgi:DNA repair protein RadA/Sms